MSVFSNPDFDAHEAVHFVHDAGTGLRAIIAVHSTALGPGAGGCRMWPYTSDAAALTDVLRLSRGMSFKNAMADLPLGGGKAVIVGNARTDKTPALFSAFGRIVEGLGGQYITAEDVGISVADMAVVAGETRYVSGLPRDEGGTAAGGDPSPKTARGVYNGIVAAVRFALGRDAVDGLRVAVQGLGGVGYNLCRELHAAGASLVVADLNTEAVQRAAEEFGAETVGSEQILFQPVDVLAPCALGGVFDAHSIPRLQTRIVAGGANNQLAVDADGERLRQRGILYAPDYVINAGGIINVAAEYFGSMTEEDVNRRLDKIGETLTTIFEQAASSAQPTNAVADIMARERIAAAAAGAGA